MFRFAYPARFEPDETDGGFVVTFRDLPEAITQGDSVEECLREAEDCLEEAIAARICDNEDIPRPSAARRGERLITVPLQTALKAALYVAVRKNHISKAELARRLGTDEKVARRLLDPHYRSRLDALERAFGAVGARPELALQ